MSGGTPQSPRRPVLMIGFLATSMVAGVLAAGLVMPAAGAVGSMAQGGVSFFDSLPAELERKPLAEASTIYANDGKTVLARFYDENRVYRPLSQIAPVMKNAILAIEDSRFYQHGGVDPRGVLRAAVNNSSGGATQGASTLTQQYVKNVLVEAAQSSGNDRALRAATAQTKARKLREMKLAIGLEKKLTKDQILEGYLNIAFFSQSTYGVEAASQLYFGHPASKLTLPEAATLAGMVQQPTNFNPIKYKDASAKRRNVVLRRMADLKMITPDEYQKAVASPLKLKVTNPRNGCANAGLYGYFCDFVDKTIVQDAGFAALGKTKEERSAAIRRGGLKIYTTLDAKTQVAAQKAVNSNVPPTDPSGLGAAAVTVEPGTGKVLAMTQNRIFDPANAKGRTTVNYSTDNAFGGSGGFQPGSTFKAFTLAAWLKSGKSVNATVDATKRAFSGSSFESCAGNIGGVYEPGNAEGNEGGSRSVLEATYLSINVAYVDMESRLDLCDIAETAESLGVHLAKPTSTHCGGKVTVQVPRCLASLTLGVVDVAPLTMAAAYAGFASGGVYCKPIVVTQILRPGENGAKPSKVAVPPPSCKQALSPGVAGAVNYALSKVLTQGTAASVGGISGYPSAGKTGTTNGPQDTWFVGYTVQRATAVWVADPGRIIDNKLVRRELRNLKVGPHDRRGRTIFGSSIAAPIWKDIMEVAQKGLPRKSFGQAPGNLLVSDGIGVPDVRGQSPGAATSALEAAGFKVRISNGKVPSNYPPGTVGDTSPGAGSRVSKGSTITLLISQGPVAGSDKSGKGRGGGNP